MSGVDLRGDRVHRVYDEDSNWRIEQKIGPDIPVEEKVHVAYDVVNVRTDKQTRSDTGDITSNEKGISRQTRERFFRLLFLAHD